MLAPVENPAARGIALGYLRAACCRGTPHRWAARRVLGELAHREGLVLGQVFEQSADAPPGSAVVALLWFRRRVDGVSAVLVPHWRHLAEDPRDQDEVRRGIERVAGVPVLSAEAVTGRPW